MEIHRSARRQQVPDADVQHTIAWAELDDDPPRYLTAGPDRAGDLLELVVLDLEDDVLIHAMRLRRCTQAELATHEPADEAEQGYEPGRLPGHRRGPGRPPLGDAAKTVASVRLEPSLRDEAARRAATEGITVSEVMRRALRQYLRSG